MDDEADRKEEEADANNEAAAGISTREGNSSSLAITPAPFLMPPAE